MIDKNEHIINRVFIEVNTNSKSQAEAFKNGIENFLKNEVFPQIEAYLEDLPIVSEEIMQQISKVTLDINVAKNRLDFTLKSTQQELKSQILEQLDTVFQQPEIHNVEVKKQSIPATKADAFFQFLEKGTMAWWQKTESIQEFSKKELFEFTEVSNFEARFLRVLQNKSQRKRLVNQFFNEELKILFLGLYRKPKGFAEILEVITSVAFTSATIKNIVWNQFAEGILQQELKTFIQFIEAIPVFAAENKITASKPQTNTRSTKQQRKFVALEKLTSTELAVYQQIQKRLEKQDLTFVQQTISEIRKEITESYSIDRTEIPVKNELAMSLKDKMIPNEKGISVADEAQKKNKQIRLDEGKVENPKSIAIEDKTRVSSKIENKEIKQEANRIKEEILVEKKVSSQENSQKETKITANTTAKVSITGSDYTAEENKTFQKQLNQEEKLKLSSQKMTKEMYQKRLEKALNVSEEIVTNPSASYLVNNAGLILVHQYLKPFFDSCGLLNTENKILRPDEAVHVLHYLATKKEQQIESNLLFEKFLCNVPLHQSISRDIRISDEIKEKTEDLLKAITQNWDVLKNSSPDLIRYEFLQRTGKLDLTKDNPQLTIERKTQDILLDRLPWNYSLCKLPWMNTLIFTDW